MRNRSIRAASIKIKGRRWGKRTVLLDGARDPLDGDSAEGRGRPVDSRLTFAFGKYNQPPRKPSRPPTPTHNCEVEGCGYSATTRGGLKRHGRTHTGERPYSCEVEGCGYTAAKRGDLAKHAKRSHP